jgi:hypothetical protein
MTEAEKMAERLESVTLFQSYEYNLALNNEAAAFIRKLAADNERLKMENVTLKMHIVNDRFLKAAPNV